ncbi:GTP cyclohydrolase II [Nocardia australiensis]|uniref:GTP cyclohydrolase II n=1 Tax=Nocardia australiensis TaxID=2887191 RepID=UPI001D15065F|nr:GTP cyclohydrolase II [Nocardia australiensis]
MTSRLALHHGLEETGLDPGGSDDTAHRFTRKGLELRVRVMEVAGGAEYGHVLIFGELTDDALVRIHSRCLYGDALGSQDCDCGPELDKAMDMIQTAGSGVLVYLEQESRGAGLVAKARGYRESEQSGTDTFTSYQTLGYPIDARTYTHAAQSLLQLGLRSVQLLTNNPAKADDIRTAGLTVTVLPLSTRPLSTRAAAYLEAKRHHRHHWIPTDTAPWAPTDWASDTPDTPTTAKRPRDSLRGWITRHTPRLPHSWRQRSRH